MGQKNQFTARGEVLKEIKEHNIKFLDLKIVDV